MIIRYRITVYYQTEGTKQLTEWMQQLMNDWKKAGKRLVASRVFEFETDKPLTGEEKKGIIGKKEGWMDEIVVEEVSRNVERMLK